MARKCTQSEKILHNCGKVVRHGLTNRIVHWAIALSIFSLFFTGFGQMPIYKRYMLAEIPGLEWTANYAITLHLHYVGALILMAAVGFHLVYHIMRGEYDIFPRKGDISESIQIIKAMITGKEEPPACKYLAEQRLAYLFIGVSVLGVIVTGIIKVVKNMPGVYLSENVIFWATHLHNLTAILVLFGVIAHLAAFIVPANRKLLPSMFTGLVDAAYVEHRHCKWWDDLKEADQNPTPTPKSTPTPTKTASLNSKA